MSSRRRVEEDEDCNDNFKISSLPPARPKQQAPPHHDSIIPTISEPPSSSISTVTSAVITSNDNDNNFSWTPSLHASSGHHQQQTSREAGMSSGAGHGPEIIDRKKKIEDRKSRRLARKGQRGIAGGTTNTSAVEHQAATSIAGLKKDDATKSPALDQEAHQTSSDYDHDGTMERDDKKNTKKSGILDQRQRRDRRKKMTRNTTTTSTHTTSIPITGTRITESEDGEDNAANNPLPSLGTGSSHSSGSGHRSSSADTSSTSTRPGAFVVNNDGDGEGSVSSTEFSILVDMVTGEEGDGAGGNNGMSGLQHTEQQLQPVYAAGFHGYIDESNVIRMAAPTYQQQQQQQDNNDELFLGNQLARMEQEERNIIYSSQVEIVNSSTTGKHSVKHNMKSGGDRICGLQRTFCIALLILGAALLGSIGLVRYLVYRN